MIAYFSIPTFDLLVVLLKMSKRRIFLSLIKSAEQLSSENQDVSDKDVDDHDNDSSSVVDDGTNIEEDITKKQVPQSSIDDQELEEPENQDEQEPVRKKIRE